MNKAINDIKACIGDAERRLSDLRAQLDSEYSCVLMEKHGLCEGIVIVSEGKRYIFAGFHHPSTLGWVKGYLIKKDGSISGVSKILYREWAKEGP